MTQPAQSSEPSMEEILASIRRIIADDNASKSTQHDMEAPKAAPPVAPVPAAAATPPEPNLAGIRAAARVDGGGADVEDQAADILDLTESMAPAPSQSTSGVAAGAALQFRKSGGHADVSLEEAGEKSPAGLVAEPLGPSTAAPDRRGDYDQPPRLLSSKTRAAVDSAFNALAQTVLVQNGRTLEDLVREMLRPMLKSWLDDNLPGMVERLVRAEIERVSRGRSG